MAKFHTLVRKIFWDGKEILFLFVFRVDEKLLDSLNPFQITPDKVTGLFAHKTVQDSVSHPHSHAVCWGVFLGFYWINLTEWCFSLHAAQVALSLLER